MKVIRIDLKKGNLLKDMAQDTPAWQNRIQVANLNIDGTRLR